MMIYMEKCNALERAINDLLCMNLARPANIAQCVQWRAEQNILSTRINEDKRNDRYNDFIIWQPALYTCKT